MCVCVGVCVFEPLHNGHRAEESGRFGEVAIVERYKQDTDNAHCMDCPPKIVTVSEVRL